jgi:hypothetical protein
MRFVKGIAVAGVVALAGSVAACTAANAASFSVGKMIELRVDPTKINE